MKLLDHKSNDVNKDFALKSTNTVQKNIIVKDLQNVVTEKIILNIAYIFFF